MENCCEYYCLNITVSMKIVVSINSFSALNIVVNTTQEILIQARLKQETKIDGEGPAFFSKKFWGYEIFSPMVPCAAKSCLKNL